ncbi:tail fiber domain-containing protein [Flavobacteriaceae bacterium]|nr:tail fiber domain-containing protein [Flavobacteriaceae bacterium]
MKKITILFLATFALVANEAISQVADQDKKPAVIFVEDGDQNPFNGKVYRSSVSGAARSGNGNSNDAFANQGDWSVDLVISERTPENAAQNFGGFTESGHPLYTGGDGNWSTISEGMGAAGWGSFAANAYNRAAGLGGVALGFNTLSGPQVGAAGGIDGGNVGQFSAGWGSRAIGNISTATGFRNTASGQASVALGNYNYATGDATIAVGKENWAEGASTVAIGYKNHAAGAGSVALGQENIAWGTTNFTSGYQNVAGDTSADAGTGGSATAMGKYNTASADATMALNRGTSATNQAATSMGLGTTADNVGMLAVGVNNAAGIGDTTTDQYYYADGQYTGAPIGVAFVVGNGDVDTSNGLAGANPSNAFVVNYDGSATLSGDLTINSDSRLKSNIVTLGSTLSRLLLIDGKSYTMKANESISKIGLLAQEVQAAFPELVKTSNNSEGTLSVNYQGMIPVLLNAIKEQQAQIDELKALIKK